MSLIINPGSGAILAKGEGWTNSEAGATKEAAQWLDRMTKDGIVGLVMTYEGTESGRFKFKFTHPVTGVSATLETHGIDDMEAYEKEFVFYPRVYWNGSSCGEPSIEDFLKDGFRAYWVIEESRATSDTTEEEGV